jgi:putative salt-induced outer membrane protein YdiY
MKQRNASRLFATFAVCAGVCSLCQPLFGQTATTEEKPKWVTSAAAGLTLTRGNSDTLLFTGDVKTGRKWEHDELRLGADLAYGENDSVKNNELYRGNVQWDHLFTERLYSFLRFEAMHDGIADVNFRMTISGGPGYYFIKNDKMQLAAEVGPGYVYERLGDGENNSYATLRIAQRFQYQINERVKLFENFEYLPQVDKWDNYVLNFEAGVQADLTKKTALRVTFNDTYRSEPVAGRDNNDMKLVTSIVWKF